MLQLFAALIVAFPLICLVLAVLQTGRALVSAALQIETRLGNGPGADAERLAQLDADLNAIRRDLNDVDERAEARYRRLTSRARRGGAPAPGAGEEPDESGVDPRQQALFELGQAARMPPHHATPSPNGAGRPRMMRAPGR